MRGKRILFFDPDVDIGRAAMRALHATGNVVEVCTALDRAVAALEVDQHDLFVLNCDPPHVADERLVSLMARGGRQPGAIVLMASGATENYLPLLARCRVVGNLVARRAGPLEPEELIVTTEKLLRGEIFGLDKYLRWGVTPTTVTLRDSHQRADYTREVVRYAEELGCGGRTIELVQSIADELISNAIFNAPRAPDGSSRYGLLSRRERVVLEDHEVAQLAFACDGNYLAVVTADPFGALTQDMVVSYLDRCMRMGPDQISDEAGGSGLGLYLAFQSLSKFIVNLAPGEKTEVIALVDLRVSMKQFRQAAKSFHVFVQPRAPGET